MRGVSVSHGSRPSHDILNEDERIRVLHEIAGIEVDLRTPVVQAILRDMHERAYAALTELATADAANAERIRELQADVRLYRLACEAIKTAFARARLYQTD